MGLLDLDDLHRAFLTGQDEVRPFARLVEIGQRNGLAGLVFIVLLELLSQAGEGLIFGHRCPFRVDQPGSIGD